MKPCLPGFLPERLLVVLALTGLLAACAVGPEAERPALDVGVTWANLPADAAEGWVPAGEVPGAGTDPADAWRRFDDAVLDDMMARLEAQNFDLQRALAVAEQARAALRASRSGLFPDLGVSASATRSGTRTTAESQFSLAGTVSWEPDLWGRVRRTVQAGEAGVRASQADVQAMRLSLQSSLAQSYFRVRALDAEADMMRRTVSAYERSLALNRNRLTAGVGERADVSMAVTQLENARAQLEALARQRRELEHALAALQGRVPSQFTLAPVEGLLARVPAVPVGLPAQLLQQRPDVVAAEERVRQAYAEIGVAQAAWFPDLSLSAQGGFRSGEWARWLSAPAQFWTLGPSLALSLLDGGARRARVDEAWARSDAQAAQYRQTVIDAVREVEDALAALDGLAREAAIQQRALAAARETLALTHNQFAAGLIDYLSVVQVETSALSAERAALTLKAEQLLAGVRLITALGGAWQGDFSGH
ncbi:MAG: efflux transporter outer membrane subunit [Castellaniella sp.]